MSGVIETRAYPAVMDHKLRRIRTRQAMLALTRAGLLGAFALVAAMTAAMTIDWCFTLFDTGIRMTLTVSAVSIAVVTLVVNGLGPLVASLGLKQAAGEADRELPQLEERWTTIASFAESNHQPLDATGRAMLQQVTSEAVAMGTLVEPRRVAHSDGLRKALLMLAVCSIVLAGLLGINWPQNRVLLQRFWSPVSEISATELKSVTGDLIVPRGQAAEITVAQSGLTRDLALLTLTTETGINETIELERQPESPSTFAYRVAAVEHSFKYRLRAGDGQTQWNSVTVVDRPALAEVRLTLTAPAYVGRPKYEKSYLPERVRAIEGSRLTLEMRPEFPLERLELRLTTEQETDDSDEAETAVETLIVVAGDDGWYRFETILEVDFSLSPVLFGPHDLTNEDRAECNIRVIADKAPVAHVISPTDEMSVNADDVIDIKFEAHDDHGIAMAELIVYDDSNTKEGELPEVLSITQIPLGDQEQQKHVMAAAQLDLSKFNFIDGANISYAIRVTDNRTGQGEAPKNVDGSTTAEPGEAHDNNDGQTADAGPSGLAESETDSSKPAVALKAKGPNSDDAGASEAEADPSGTGTATTVTETDPRSDAGESKEGGPAAEVNSGTDESTNEPGSAPATSNDAQSDDANGTTKPARDQPDSDAGKPGPNAPAETPTEGGNESDDTATAAAAPGETNEQPGNGEATKSETESDDGDDKATGTDAPTPDASSPEGADSDQTTAASVPDEPEDSSDDADRPEGSSPTSATARDSEDDPQSKPDEDVSPTPRSGTSRQVAMSGQNTVSNRLRLKVIGRSAPDGSSDGGNNGNKDQKDTAQWLEQMDGELEAAEVVLQTIDTELSESAATEKHVEQVVGVDSRLSNVEQIIGNVRKATIETQLAFAGLQLVQIGRSYVTPARDRVFVLIRQPDADFRGNVSEALQRVTRARELLGALMKRVEKIKREKKLADDLKKAEKIYEVYVKNVQRLMREARQNKAGNSLKRKMEVIEVDQAYLDRLREVLEMRADMMAEFGRILADDPRLLVKYMDVIRRRQTSLRDGLRELHEQQADLTEELVGWRQVAADRRDDVWLLAAELRLYAAAPIAREASQLEERTQAQLPLSLDKTFGTPKRIIEHAKQIAVRARSIASKARRRIRRPFDDNSDLMSDLGTLAYHIAEYDVALEELDFEVDDEESDEFVLNRLAENRSVAEQVVAWAESAQGLQSRKFHTLARVDQEGLAQRTELLRVQMTNIEDQLDEQFQDDVPAAILAIANELQLIMEDITFNQMAATYALTREDLEAGEAQELMAVDGFAQAEELFDKMRRMVIEELDQIDPDDPEIDQLEDPTLDQFLQRLEREPNLNALLGIPNRPRNLRIMTDWMVWNQKGQDGGGEPIEESVNQAMKRAENEKQRAKGDLEMAKEDRDPTEEEWEKVANAQEAQEKLDEKIAELKKKAEAPDTDEAEAEELRRMGKQLEQLRDELGNREIDNKEWRELAKSDQMKAVMRAMASGESLPDTQWNTLMSSLDKGLWQVKRRTLPEDHRAAIEQYQEQIRRLINLGAADDDE